MPRDYCGAVPARLFVLFRFDAVPPYLPRAPGERGILQAAPGRAVITPQHRSERVPQGSVSSLWTGVSKCHYPPRSHRARCAKPGPGLTLIARPACPSPPEAGGLGGASCAAGTRVLCLQYRVFNFRCTSEGEGKCVLHLPALKWGFGRDINHHFSKNFGASFLPQPNTQQHFGVSHSRPRQFAALSVYPRNTAKGGGAGAGSSSYQAPP